MHIAVSGNIGSGKTTLATMLGKHFGWQIELEDVETNPYLEDFYEDMKKWSFHLQVYFLNSRFKQVKKINQSKSATVQDRTIYEDAYIFAANLHQSGYLEERDYQNYLKLFHSMMEYVEPPDLLIYLKAEIPKLVSQIQKRGRDYENNISINYLKNLNQHYEDWVSSYDRGKLLIIDVNNTDFVHKPEDFGLIVNKIDCEINGLFS
ncbi:deoxynucleoside kinase [Echinicola sp. CAU 1574]|uniref:Deoxynucleoside kinase n=1 Tax=Echinicola arenosa TaxID=2774144 RepID=A0ABR9AS62_9BACT|nr:deoxynucleoside kinase [Echinicola arenosa]MBD8490713.1 deoxynucleoside kinase [Echinicola arenosa]